VQGRGRVVVGQPGCWFGMAAAAAGSQCQEEPGAPGTKTAGMSSLPGRRAEDGAPSLYSSNLMLSAKGDSSRGFPSSSPSREPAGMKGTAEMSCVVWGWMLVGRIGRELVSLASAWEGLPPLA